MAKERTKCEHETFAAHANIARISGLEGLFMLQVQVVCAQCGATFICPADIPQRPPALSRATLTTDRALLMAPFVAADDPDAPTMDDIVEHEKENASYYAANFELPEEGTGDDVQ